MSTGSWTHEVAVAAPADRLFKAAMLDWHNLGPKVLPHVIASAEVWPEEGGVRGVREIRFTPGKPYSHVKERLQFVDKENFEIKSTLIGGGNLGTVIKSSDTHYKVEPNGSSCIVKISVNYSLLQGVEFNDKVIKKRKEGFSILFKAAETYLVANPTAYT